MNLIEKITGNNYVPIEIFIQNNINLAISLIIKNEEENNHINSICKNLFKDNVPSEKEQQKYYLNLAGKYYKKNIIDKPVYIQSKDNYETIELTKENLQLHKNTRNELLKFGSYYKELVSNYVLQELYIKSVIMNVDMNESEIINKPNFTIIGYNSNLIEEQEVYLIPELQERLYNYSVTWLLPYYAISDSLYLSAQINEMYMFLFKSILALRLNKVKTNFAHSFFIFYYLASHHYLDNIFLYLNRKQLLYLYRNLLYLQNHSGNNFVFNEIINYIFTERNIAITSYDYKLLDSKNENNFMNYKFKQRLLNNKNLPYNKNDFSLEDLRDKELFLAKKNEIEYKTNISKIDLRFRNSLFNELKTKDIESITIDFSDNVRFKIIDTIIDNYVYLVGINKLNYFINYTNPLNNETRVFSTEDFLKLFTIVLYLYNEENIVTFPSILVKRVYKEDTPSFNEIKNFLYKNKYYYVDEYNNIINNIPRYTTFVSSFMFYEYIEQLYKFNIAIWLYLSNLDDKNDYGQFELIEKLITKEYLFTFSNNETVDQFLKRFNIENIRNLSKENYEYLFQDILNALFDYKLNKMFNASFIQKALIEVFKVFKSYSTQLIREYFFKDFLLCGIKDTRCAINVDIQSFIYFYDARNLNVESKLKTKQVNQVNFKDNSLHGYLYKQKEFIDLNAKYLIYNNYVNKVNINFSFNVLDINSNSNLPSQEHLEFLALSL